MNYKYVYTVVCTTPRGTAFRPRTCRTIRSRTGTGPPGTARDRQGPQDLSDKNFTTGTAAIEYRTGTVRRTSFLPILDRCRYR